MINSTTTYQWPTSTIVMGDLNASIGSDRIAHRGIIGPVCSGFPNDNPSRLLDFCASNDLRTKEAPGSRASVSTNWPGTVTTVLPEKSLTTSSFRANGSRAWHLAECSEAISKTGCVDRKITSTICLTSHVMQQTMNSSVMLTKQHLMRTRTLTQSQAVK